MNSRNLSFTIFISAHKSLHFAKRCIQSIQWQEKDFNVDVIYVDDASFYNVQQKEELKDIVKSVNGKVFFSDKRLYQIGAFDQYIPKIENKQTIVCLLDGDDYLLPHALSTLHKTYSNPEVLMSYGNTLLDFRPFQDSKPKYFYDKKTVNIAYSKEVWQKRSFREDGFRCFHLRSFYRWLWDFVKSDGFYRKDGTYFRASGDSAFVYPMLEMLADPKHVVFIEDPIYVYRLHEGNVHNHDKKSQSDDLNTIRFSLPKYKPLERHILNHFISGSL
ncbi:MAG: hypothetical protein K940chlam8_00004 [Chlamydiae bacterium]|nr:hypothetical protein [Chlamydiota bacterium]